MSFTLDRLRPRPGTAVAVDATDRLLLDEAASLLRGAAPGEVSVLDDRHGALTLGAAGLHGVDGIRVHQDSLVDERTLDRNASDAGLSDAYRRTPLQDLVDDRTRVLLLRLPKSLESLRETVHTVARSAHPSLRVLAGGPVKHLTPAMNTVLAERFDHVSASLARQKARILRASAPRSDRPEACYPLVRRDEALGLSVHAHGAVFAGATVDLGTRFLLSFLDRMAPDARDAIDLGCGSGILATVLAARRPGLRVLATDESAAAVASAAATAAAHGVGDRVRALRDDVLSAVAGASADLIVCNPPFHVGATLSTGPAHAMLAAAGRVLRPGGELWTVYNSPLAYRGALTRLVGPTRQMGRDRRFTVTCSVRA